MWVAMGSHGQGYNKGRADPEEESCPNILQGGPGHNVQTVSSSLTKATLVWQLLGYSSFILLQW